MTVQSVNPRHLRHREWRRLNLALGIQQAKIEQRSSGGEESWAASAGAYRSLIEQLGHRRDVDEAWELFKAADRELLHAYTDEELEDETVRVRLEAAGKLTGWRKDFVLQTIPDVGKGPFPTVDRLKECRRVFDDALDNRYRKLSLLRQFLRTSAVVLLASLVVAVVTWVFAIRTGFPPGRDGHLLSDWRSVLVVLSFGSLGASLSALLTLKDQKLDARIPDLHEQWTTNLWRPLVGAASAFVLVLILQSGVAGLTMASPAALVVAVIAGFSEQAVSSAIGKASASTELVGKPAPSTPE